MTERRTPPSAPQRRLASELRKLREATGQTLDVVADEIVTKAAEAAEPVKVKMSRAKLSRLERAHQKINLKDTTLLCAHLDASDELTEMLIALAKDNRKEWWRAIPDVFPSAFVGFETEASAIHTFQPEAVPGLLQTPDYARAITRAARPFAGSFETDRRVQARLQRQAILDRDDPPLLRVVLGEAVLRRAGAEPDVGRKQLEHLLTLAERPGIDLQVLPFAVGLHAATEGSFTALQFADDLPIVFTETPADGWAIHEEPDELDRFETTFDNLRTQALDRRSSTEMIHQAARELG